MKILIAIISVFFSCTMYSQDYMKMNKKDLRTEFEKKLSEIDKKVDQIKDLESINASLLLQNSVKDSLILVNDNLLGKLKLELQELNRNLNIYKLDLGSSRNKYDSLVVINDSLSLVVTNYKDTINNYVAFDSNKNQNRIQAETYWQRVDDDIINGFEGLILTPSLVCFCADENIVFVNGTYYEDEYLITLEKDDNITSISAYGWDDRYEEYRTVKIAEFSETGERLKVKILTNNETYYYKKVKNPPCQFLQL